MPRFACDRCGACCQGHLIVEADEIDLLREPRLMESDSDYADKPVDDVLDALRADIGRVLIIACGTERPCTFLDADKTCAIYPTRPSNCVAMHAGDEQCQSSRREAGLPPLEPVQPSKYH